MADNSQRSYSWQQQEPLVLTIPERANVSPDHWQSLWESKRSDCRRVDLGMWDKPHRNTWVNQLNLAIHRADRPVVLVAHGLGCLAASWWAEYEGSASCPVVGALLVAPPDVDRPGLDPSLAWFGSCSRQQLAFPSFLVVSHDDPLGSYRTARALARDWGSRFADAGAVGHIDAGSGLDDWPFGEKLLEQLLLEHRRVIETAEIISRPAAPSQASFAGASH